ncbi:MAG: hypothetical protein VXW43_19780, partial [Pseudomonadota bacterium]|nr:hypothetical protein [Pseudomonadota bacterium]
AAETITRLRVAYCYRKGRHYGGAPYRHRVQRARAAADAPLVGTACSVLHPLLHGAPDAAAAQLLALRLLPAHLASRLLLPRLHVLHQKSDGDGWAPSAEPPPAAEAAPPGPHR